MATWGDKLDGDGEEQLRQQLRTETGAKAVKHLTSALLYGQGKSPAEIEKLLGSPEQTVYDWHDTVAERDLTTLGDLPCPDQSTRLTEDQWIELMATPPASPSKAGYDEPTWTPALVRDYIAETFDIEYSLAHMDRVMKWVGLSHQTARATTKQILPTNSADVPGSKKVAGAEGEGLPDRRH